MFLVFYLLTAILHCQTSFCNNDVFAVVPKSQDVYAGRNAVFRCALNDEYKEFYHLSWHIDEKLIEEDRRRYIGSDGYLHFDPVDKDLDHGSFDCVATSNQTTLKSVTASASLNIKWLNITNVILLLPSGHADILPGSAVTLKCNTSGSPRPQVNGIEWRLNESKVEDHSLKFGRSKGKLLIARTKLRIYDGWYSCCLPEGNRIKCSIRQYFLHVRDKSVPVVTEYPKDLTVRLMDNAVFTCAFDAFPPPKIEWLRDDDPVKRKQSPDCRVCNFGNGTLFIKNVRDRHEGEYTCQATGVNGNVLTASAKLTIAYIKNFSNPNTELKYLNNGQGLEKVCCPPEAEPSPSITWMRKGQKILPNARGPTSRVTVSGETLVFQSVQPSDEGEYKCVAENIAGSVTKIYEFRIRRKPEITSGLVGRKEREGSDVTLKCSANGVPPPNFTWLQNNTVIRTSKHFQILDNQLTISKVSAKDAAEYKCTVDNGVGFASSSAFIAVDEWLKFDAIPRELCIEAHKVKEIVCVARGHRDAVVEWNVDPSSEKSKIVKNGPANQSLILVDPLPGDHWTAHCTANAARSLDDLSPKPLIVDIFVGKRPTIAKPPQDSVVFKGQSVRLDCGIDSGGDIDFDRLRWKAVTNTSTREYTLKNNSDSNKYNVMNNGSFFIKDASSSDSGTYSCHYEGCGFNVSKQALLDVAGEQIPTPTGSDEDDSGNTASHYKKIQTVALAAGCAVTYLIITITIIVYCKRKKRHGRKKSSSSKKTEVAEESPLMRNGSQSQGNRVAKVGDHMMMELVTHLGEDIELLQYDQSKLDHVTIIGHGEFGEVYLSRAPGLFADLEDDVLVMVKNITSVSSTQENDDVKHGKQDLRYEFNREIRLLQMADHENVGKILGVCAKNTVSLNTLDCFITEYLEWGILKLCLQASSEGKLQRFSKAAKMKMCYQIAAGLEHLTKIRLCHQDVATRNCLISSKLLVKLSVLSLKKEGFENEYAYHKGMLMPIRWVAPETLSTGSYELKSDVWSFGVTCWEIFTLGTLPFSDLSDDQFLQEMESEHPPTLPVLDGSKRMTSLISKCCQKSRSSRPEFHQIVKKLHTILGMGPGSENTVSGVYVDSHTNVLNASESRTEEVQMST